MRRQFEKASKQFQVSIYAQTLLSAILVASRNMQKYLPSVGIFSTGFLWYSTFGSTLTRNSLVWSASSYNNRICASSTYLWNLYSTTSR